MKELSLKEVKHWDKKEYEKYLVRVKEIKKEKNLMGDDIKEILLKKFKKDFLTITEKNHIGVNENPFDLVIGDEEDLNMCGFEIKGDTDNFGRLKTQLQAYIFCFDKVYLVLHKKKKPEWLPEYIGVIRVFENGDLYEEVNSYFRDYIDISTFYEWDALFRNNNLGISSKKTKEVLKIIQDIRRNVLFNRFFSILPYGSKQFEKFYPFTEQQKTVMIGFDVPYHFKLFNKDLVSMERRLENLKQAISVGQKGLKEFKNG